MGASTSRSGLARLFAAVLLIVLMLASAVPVGASDDEEGSGIGMDALAGLGLDEGGGEPEQSPTGDLNDPLAGGSGGSSEGGDTEETSSEPGTDQGSDPVDPATSETNPMFKAAAAARGIGEPLYELLVLELTSESVRLDGPCSPVEGRVAAVRVDPATGPAGSAEGPRRLGPRRS